jgi:hypothetical protein
MSALIPHLTYAGAVLLAGNKKGSGTEITSYKGWRSMRLS